MKRLFLSLALVLSVVSAYGKIDTKEKIQRDVESKREACENPRTGKNPATWIAYAESLINAYEAPQGLAWLGMSQKEFSSFLGYKTNNKERVDFGEYTYEVLTYKDCKYYFNSEGKLEMIIPTVAYVEDALDKALEAYSRSYSLGVNKSTQKKIAAGIEKISDEYATEGYNMYTIGEYAVASVKFEKSAKASETEPFASSDGGQMYYDAALNAQISKDIERALELYTKCLDLRYYDDGFVFGKLGECYNILGNTDKALEIWEQGFKMFPENQGILIGMINFYMEHPEGDLKANKLLALLDKVIANEPNTASHYLVKGEVLLKIGAPDNEVEAAFNKSVEVDPEYVMGYASYGQALYGKAVEIIEQANDSSDDEYDALVRKMDALLLKAAEYFEKAFKISKDEEIRVWVAEYLMNIYGHFKEDGKKYQDAYDKYNRIVEESKK